MTEWVIVIAGLCIGCVATTTVIACTTANQVELYRWITGLSSGAKAARTLLSAPSRVLGSARGMAAAGTLIAALGLRAVLDGLAPVVQVTSVLFLAVPLAAIILYALPNAIGSRWSASIIEEAVPLVGRLAAVFAPALPQGASVRPREDLVKGQLQRVPSETVGSDELTLVSGVLSFTEMQVSEVMTPRTEVVAVSESSSIDEVSKAFLESGFSRLPLYSDTLDNIIGIYYAFDLLKILPGGELPVRPITAVPTTKACADLLFEMQRDCHQVAVVLDEYGGTAGIATMNDLLTELVEETFYAVESELEETVSHPPVIEVPGATPVDEVTEKFGISYDGGLAETVGGLLSSAVGRIPAAGERFEMSGLEFDVIEATATRVERVTVRLAAVATVHIDSPGVP